MTHLPFAASPTLLVSNKITRSSQSWQSRNKGQNVTPLQQILQDTLLIAKGTRLRHTGLKLDLEKSLWLKYRSFPVNLYRTLQFIAF